MNADEINRKFEEAAIEDRKLKGATPPRKPRNRLFSANKKLQEIATERKEKK